MRSSVLGPPPVQTAHRQGDFLRDLRVLAMLWGLFLLGAMPSLAQAPAPQPQGQEPLNQPVPGQPAPAQPAPTPPVSTPPVPTPPIHDPIARPDSNPAPETVASPAAHPPTARSSNLQLPSAQARLATGPIIIDGKLDEAAWRDASVITLTQQSPHPGKETPYRTEVRILIYKDALIFGFKCIDPNPEAIQTHSLARDGNQLGDDTVTIELDSFGDKHTAYYFQINSAAARYDGLVSGAGQFSPDWDGIWDARTARTREGWTAEIWIPAQTLNFAASSVHWGLQLDRAIERDLTELRWSSPTLDSIFYDMSRAGDLELLSPLKQGHGLEFAPYVNGKMINLFPTERRNWLGESGGELTWRITPQLAAVFTVNTDFAETEVDSRQINITPFPLYFPEKRAFFLEGANQYDNFGVDLTQPKNQYVGLPVTFLPFFSRNVGLLDGYDIPINGGVKLNGHVGPWSIAFLDVQTRDTYVPTIVNQALGLPSAKVNGTNLLASRIAYDVDKHLRLGTILTHGDPEALLSNALAGADALWRSTTFMKNRTIEFGGWFATTQGDVPRGNRQAWGARFEYPNDLLNCSAGTNHFNDGFEPLMGFLPRPGTHQQDASCSIGPRPSPTGPFRAVRQALVDLSFQRFTDTNGNLISREFLVDPLRLDMNSGDQLILRTAFRHETLTTPFVISPSLTYPVGSYDFVRYSSDFISSQKRPIQFENLTTFGGYYSGHLFRQFDTLNWTPGKGRVELGVTADNYFGHAPQGHLTEKLWQFNGTLSLNPNLSLSSFVQYDNISFALSSNTRLRWTFKPGDDFFVIWDRTWIRNVTHPGTNLDPDAESITAKIRWTFRL